MLKFKTKVWCIYGEDKPRIFSNPGSPEVDLYDSKYDDDGHLVVFKSGKSNLQDYINSFRESCDINNLVAKYQRGEILDFNFVQGAYIDASNMPTNYAEMVNFVKEGNEVFDSLPSELKEQFNNNAVEFFMQYGNDEFITKVSKFTDAFNKKHAPKDEVKDEQKSDE